MNKTALLILLLLIVSASVSAQTVKTVGDDPEAYYPNLEFAFSDINDGTLTGDIVLEIIADAPQTGTAVIYPPDWSTSNYNSITIYPTVVGAKISGDVPGPLIELNGVTTITFDGRVNKSGSTADLIISNTSTDASATTFTFTESASGNIIKYCVIKGSGTGSAKGIIDFSSSTTGNGNDNNTLQHNHITADPAGRPVNGIYSMGSSGSENSGNIISNNNFYDLLNKAMSSSIINLGGYTTGWTISDNSFYETSSFAPTANTTLTAININNTSGNGFIITGNYIGGNSALCAGTAWVKTNAFNTTFNAININAGTSSATSLQNNTIANFSWSNAGSAGWTAINISAGNVNVGTTTGNTIGSSTGTGSITFTAGATGSAVLGINIQGSGAVNCLNNSIGSITVSASSGTFSAGFFGIRKAAVAGSTNINDNIIGSETTSNSIQVTSASTGNSQTVYGIRNDGTGNVTISGNTVANLSNSTTNATGSLAGIVFNGGTGINSVSKNFVKSLSAVCPVAGIGLLKGVVTSSNNIISLSGNTQTPLSGIYTSEAASDNYILFYNTVYIGGSPATGSENTYALYSNSSSGSRDFRNNLFVNARSNSGATGKHYAIYFNATGGTLTCNYNDYYTPGTGGVPGYYGGDIALLPIVTAQDANSLLTDPAFSSPGGTLYSDYRTSNSAIAAGQTVSITDDYTGLPRGATPTFGALESAPCTNPVSGGSISLVSPTGCSPFDPANITSSGLPSGYSGTLEYKWQFSTTGAGSGFTDIDGTNSITYNPGIITSSTWYRRIVRVTCTSDWSGAAESNVIAVTVNTPPVAGTITGAAAICNENTTTLSANVTGTPAFTYTWSSTNTSVATVNNSGFVTSVGPGSTNITYTVTDGNTPSCQATSPVFVFTVNPLPTAFPITGDNSVCSNGSLTLSANASGTAPLSYSWTSSNTFFATVNSSGIVDPNAAGSTDIRYIVTDGSSTACSAQSAPHTVAVKDAPLAGAITGSNSVCLGGGTISLTPNATGTPVLTYTWTSSNPAVATIDNSGIVTPVSAGTTEITYIVTDGNPEHCAETSPDFTVTVKALPNAGLVVSGSGSVCSGTGTNITVDLSENGVNYQLRNDSDNSNIGSPVTGNGGTISLPTGNLTTSTTFNIFATDISSSCSVQLAEKEIVTVDLPSVGGSVSGGTPTIIYGGTTGTMTLSGHTGSILKWQKQENAGNWQDVTNTGLTYSETPSSSAIWKYRAEVRNGACPAEFSSYQTITVSPKPLTVTANDRNKVYGTTVSFAGTEFIASGLVGNDVITGVTLTSSGSAPIAGVSASPYPIIPSGAVGTGLSNYVITYANGLLTVAKASLTFTAENKTKVYLAALPALTYTITGFVNSETEAVLDALPSIQTTAQQNSNAGNYPISLSGGSDNNYSYNLVAGTLTITKIVQTITFTEYPEKLKVSETYILSATSSSGLEVLFESLDPGLASVTGNQLTGVEKGDARIRAYHPGNMNYETAESMVTVKIYSTHKDIKNLFTPNNDGINDYWELPEMDTWGKCSVRIYNRWGKLVYANDDYDNLWDGTSEGTPLPEGPYVYIIETENSGMMKGMVNIVR